MAGIAVLVLAAGASSRMCGADKLLEPVDGVPLIAHVVRTALDAQIGPVTVTLPVKPHARYAALQGLDVQTLPVPDAAEGIAASFRAGFSRFSRSYDKALILLADHPELTVDDLQKVAAAPKIAPKHLIWRATSSDGVPGHPILVDAALFSAFRTLRGDTGGRAIIQAAQPLVFPVALPDARATTDLDTPEAWAAWRAKTGR